jgi:hypothetical protein
VWQLLDSKQFDGALGLARAAITSYLLKKGGEWIVKKVSGKPQIVHRAPVPYTGPDTPQYIEKTLEAVVSTMPQKNKNNKKQGHKSAGVSFRPVRTSPLKTLNRIKKAGVRSTKRDQQGGFSRRTASVPLSKGSVMRNRGPSMNGRKSAIVSHSEYLGEVAGSLNFVNTEFSINPGLVQSFPWLAQIAIQYEQYKFRRLAYRFEPSAAATKTGSVILVTDYDALDTAFVSKDQAMQYKGAVRTLPWESAVHRVSGKESSPYKQRYVRASSVPTGGDQKTYDLGNFQLITSGQDATTTIGEIYVDYEIELIGPKTNNILGANLLGADIRAGGTVNQANPLGSAPTQVDGTTIDVNVNGNSFTLNVTGRFLLYYYMVGTVITNCAFGPAGGATTVTDYGGAINAAATVANACMSIDTETNQGQGVAINVTATTVTSSLLVISQISGAMAAPKPKVRKGLAILQVEDPLAKKIAALEALVRKMGLGCPACDQVGSHADNCPQIRGRPTSSTTLGGL